MMACRTYSDHLPATALLQNLQIDKVLYIIKSWCQWCVLENFEMGEALHYLTAQLLGQDCQ